jgi:hypothetical protein
MESYRIRCTFQQNQAKLSGVHVLHETGEAPAEVTRVTSKIMEACFKPQEGWLNAEKRVASPARGIVNALRVQYFFFTIKYISGRWTFVEHPPPKRHATPH